MPEPFISALIQAPFVLVMVYLVHRFLAYLNAHDLAWQERIADLTEAIDNLTDLIVAHDAATRSATKSAHQPVTDSDVLSEVEQWRAAASRRR